MPEPISDRGGLRVDTGNEAEICRWVFARPSTAITDLTREIDRPGYLIKLSEPSATLAALLTGRWRLESENCVMVGTGFVRAAPVLPPGYRFDAVRSGTVTHCRILAPDGLLAASGYAAEVDGAFIYDRILTVPEHRRRGLGIALMQELAAQRITPDSVDVLTATVAGRALYERLGWTRHAPWATAAVSVAEQA